jgi:DNA-binding transcriptional ArsR family regulator
VQAVLEAIATPRRREILHLVWDTELTAGQIAANFDVSWPAISQNLRVLREAGVITERRDGNRRLYRANESGLGSLAGVLRQMWATDLDSLKRVVESDSGSGDDG